jgi:tripeptide aminopeptidase
MASHVAPACTRSVADLAQSRAVQECLQFFTREKQWINEKHLELCRIPAPTFLEQQRASWMAAQFESLGFSVEIDRAGNVVAYESAHRDGPWVALTAHLDTVLAPRRTEDVYVDQDGRLRGPGVSDNGAGLAALLAVARAVKSSPPIDSHLGELVLVANVGEEGEGNLSGMRYLCSKSPLAGRVSAFLVLDGPVIETITTQALGSRRFEVVFSGAGGHSWSDFGVSNPVHALCRAVVLFSESQSTSRSPDEPRCSYNFGVLEGGSSVNSIPTEALAKVDLRSESVAKMDELVAALNSAVEQALEVENDRATGARLSVRVREIGSRPGSRLPDDALILTLLRAVDAHLGIRSQTDCSSTDANIPLSLGLPAVSIGAGGNGGGAHTAGEWFHPEGRDLGLKRILLTLCLLAQDPRTMQTVS